MHKNILKFKRRLCGQSLSQKRKSRQKFLKRKRIIENNIVTNLSNMPLSVAQIEVLNKGLGFVPYNHKPKFDITQQEVERFERRLQLHFFFHKKD